MATTPKGDNPLAPDAPRATPEQFIAGLTDVGPDRSKLFKNCADAYSAYTARPQLRQRGGTVVAGVAT